MMRYLYSAGTRAATALWRNERGIGTLEIVMIAAVLIIIALLFKDWIVEFLNNLMDNISGKADTVFD